MCLVHWGDLWGCETSVLLRLEPEWRDKFYLMKYLSAKMCVSVSALIQSERNHYGETFLLKTPQRK